MFDLPDAKRIRRSDLYAGSDEGGSRASLSEAEDHDGSPATDLFRQRMNGLLNLDAGEAENLLDTSKDQAEHGSDKQEEDEGFEFNLFAPGQALGDSKALDASAAPSQDPTEQRQRIRLSPDASAHPGSYRYLQKKRPLSYYFTQSDEDAHQRFKSVALDADFIMRRAAQPWPDGRILDSKKPWRVSIWTASPSLGDNRPQSYIIQGSGPDEERKTKRTRVGKKTRIRRRVAAMRRARKDEDKARKKEEEVKRLAEKEEHIRKKKSEMNRKKQIRKREKERERKATEGATTADT